MNEGSISAFPVASACGEFHPEFGLSKRELLAAMAMQGLLANDCRLGSMAEYASTAVQHADALMAALAVPRQGTSHD